MSPTPEPAPSQPDEARRHRAPPRFAPLTTLPLHILRDLAKSVGTAMLVFIVLLTAVEMGKIFLRDSGSLVIAARVWPLLIPIISPYVLPFAIVTGVLVTYGRLVADREYLAAQAGGVHPLWLAVPAGVMATVAVFIVVTLNEFALTAAAESIEAIIVADQKNILERRLERPGSFTQATGGGIIALCRLPNDSGVADKKQAGLVIAEFHPANIRHAFHDDRTLWDPEYPWPTTVLIARNHHISPVERDARSRELKVKIKFENAVRYDFDGGRLLDARMGEALEAGPPPIFLGGGGRRAISGDDIDYASMMRLLVMAGNLRQREHDARERLQALESERYALAARPRPAPGNDPDAESRSQSLDEAVDEARNTLGRARRHLNRTVAALHSKVVLAFSCFCFAFLGVPMGLAARRSGGVAVTNFLMGVGVAVCYYLALWVLEHQVGNGRVAWPFLWLPNLALMGMALLFVRRARRMAM